MPRNQIHDTDQLIGKTIKAAFRSSDDSQVLLGFSDGTFMVLSADVTDMLSEADAYINSDLSCRMCEFSEEELIEAGLDAESVTNYFEHTAKLQREKDEAELRRLQAKLGVKSGEAK